MTTASEALKIIKDSGAKYLDLRFTDVKGKMATSNNGRNYC